MSILERCLLVEPDPESAHVHGPDCGHERVFHGDHTDYLVRWVGYLGWRPLLVTPTRHPCPTLGTVRYPAPSCPPFTQVGDELVHVVSPGASCCRQRCLGELSTAGVVSHGRLSELSYRGKDRRAIERWGSCAQCGGAGVCRSGGCGCGADDELAEVALLGAVATPESGAAAADDSAAAVVTTTKIYAAGICCPSEVGASAGMGVAWPAGPAGGLVARPAVGRGGRAGLARTGCLHLTRARVNANQPLALHLQVPIIHNVLEKLPGVEQVGIWGCRGHRSPAAGRSSLANAACIAPQRGATALPPPGPETLHLHPLKSHRCSLCRWRWRW